MAFFQIKSYKASYNKQGLLLFSTHNMKNILEWSKLQPICCSLAGARCSSLAMTVVKQNTCFLHGVLQPPPCFSEEETHPKCWWGMTTLAFPFAAFVLMPFVVHSSAPWTFVFFSIQTRKRQALPGIDSYFPVCFAPLISSCSQQSLHLGAQKGTHERAGKEVLG